MQALPPLTLGKKVSITLCPVVNGSRGANFSLTGLCLRTGQRWAMVMAMAGRFQTNFIVLQKGLVSERLSLQQLATQFRPTS